MARPKTPTAILDARGAFIHDPDRARPNEPKSSRPLGGPPKHLSAEEKKIWKDIARRMPPGVVTASDRDAFELMVRLTHQMRNDVDNLLMKAADRTLLVSLWGRFAMTPADRSRVAVPQGTGSKLDAFKKRKPAPAPQAA